MCSLAKSGISGRFDRKWIVLKMIFHPRDGVRFNSNYSRTANPTCTHHVLNRLLDSMIVLDFVTCTPRPRFKLPTRPSHQNRRGPVDSGRYSTNLQRKSNCAIHQALRHR